MTIRHDADKGWTFSDGEPPWRATTAAFNRLAGAQVAWTSTTHARVASILGAEGRTVANAAVIRHVPAHRQWVVRIEGYAFWGDNRVLGHAHYKDVATFGKVAEARAFVEAILRQSGAAIVAKAAR